MYDWTYTTTYSGHNRFDEPAENEDELPPASESTPIAWKPADPENPADAIPMAELTRSDPILFYAEIPLYEDELHDNGSSTLIARIVSPHTFLLIRVRVLMCGPASNADLLVYPAAVYTTRR